MQKQDEIRRTFLKIQETQLMKKNTLYQIITIATCITLQSAAIAATKSAVCPSADAIKQRTLMVTKDDDDDTTNRYSAGQVGYFGTTDQWMFGINCIVASSEEDAKKAANDILAHLTGPTSPSPTPVDGDEGSSSCLYSSTSVYAVFPKNCFNSIYAISPIPTINTHIAH